MSSKIPRLRDVQQNGRIEIEKLSNRRTGKFKFDFKTIITIERCFDLGLKLSIVIFIGFMLSKQVSFINTILIGVAEGKFDLDPTTLQIVVSATIVEFILAIKIVITSLFPANDRKNSLDYMQGNTQVKKTNESSNIEENTPEQTG